MTAIPGAIDILLVEDNHYDVEMTRRIFRRFNLPQQIFHVEDGAEAVDLLFKKGKYSEAIVFPKLVLLDIQMPKINGLEVLEMMKSNKSTDMIPVVMLTSSREEADIRKSYSLGANSYVVKPVDYEEYADTINQVILYWLNLNQPPIIKS